MSAADPAEFAASSGLNYEPDGVVVIVELVGDAEPDALTFGLSEQVRSANLLQTRAPLDQLCSLAADPTVASVRPPAGRAPAGTDPP